MSAIYFGIALYAIATLMTMFQIKHTKHTKHAKQAEEPTKTNKVCTLYDNHRWNQYVTDSYTHYQPK